MGKLSSPNRIAFVHIGTHKTGTTSLQALLGKNETLFRDAGVFVPKTGRLEPHSAGHHNIAWELGRDDQFDRRLGTFEALLHEAAAADAPNVCLTSEAFELLHGDPAALQRLRDGLLGIGYTPAIILYLRPQVDYLESLYAEIIKAWDCGFEEYLETVLSLGAWRDSLFEYDRLADSFANVFGRDRMIVRAYRSSSASASLLREFAGIIAPALPFQRLRLPTRLNPMAVFPEIIATRARQLACDAHHRMSAKQRFDPLSLIDLLRIVVRFSRANERIARTYGAKIACVTQASLARELITVILRDRSSRHRKQLIRALAADATEIAA
jgi:hypothetical protein